MPSMSELVEAALQSIVPQLEADGFVVLVRPTEAILPPFLHEVRPDAIAYKGDRKVLLEVISNSQHDKTKLHRLREILPEHTDWELQVVSAPSLQDDNDMPVLTRSLIESHLKRIEAAFDAMGPAAALLMAWASFEAAARRLVPASLGSPQSPANLLEALASDGYVAPVEAFKLRQLGRLRNEVAHGRLDASPRRDEVELLVAATRMVLDFSDEEATA